MAERTNPHANLIIGAQDEASPVFDKIKASSQGMAAGVEQAAAKAGQAVDGIGAGAEKSADKFTRAESLMRAAIMKSTRELELLGKTASQRFEAQIDFKGLEKAKFQEAISGLQAMESALSVAKAREAEFAAQNGFSLKAAQAKELVKASEYARWWAQELEKVEAAEKRLAGQNSFINSLKSQADAIGKTKADLLEMQAAQMGVATQAAPFIAKMREADAGIGKMGMSAKQTTAALRQVPMQFTDIVVSLQGGQSAMQVVLQQGGQLKDMFGGAGNAARALGGYVLGLVNPFTIAAAAVAGIAVAYNQGSKEAEAFNKTLILSGNAAGTSADSLSDMARAIDATSNGITQSKAAEVLNSIAASGDVAADKLQRYAQVAIEFERAGGGAADEVAKALSSLAGDPLTAVEKLNKSTNFLTAEIYNQIKAFEDEGRSTDAARVAQDAYASMLDQRIPKLKDNLGLLERGWMGVKGAAAEAWDSMLNVGRAQTIGGRLEAAQKLLADYESTLPGKRTTEQVARVAEAGGVNGLRSQIAGLQELMETQRKADEQQRANNQSTQAAINLSKQASQFDTDLEKQRKAVAQATELYSKALAAGNLSESARAQLEKDYLKTVAGITAVKEKRATSTRKENKDLADQSRIFAELAGVSSTYYTELAAAQAQRAKGNISEAQYVAYVEELIQKQPFAVALAKEETEANKALSKSYAEAAAERLKTIQSMERAADSLQSQNDALREEIELIGLSTEQQTLVLQQRNDVIILTKEATLAELERQSAITGTQTRVEIALASEIEALKERNALLGAKGVKNAAVDAAKSAADEWQKTSDKINDTLTDALMRGFESGKDFAKNLGDTVVNMFKTMVLRPVISAIVNPVAGAVTGMMGLSGSANASTGGASMLGNVGSLIGAGSSAFGIGAGFMSGVSETVLGSAFVGPSATAAGGATGMAAQLGAVAPYIAAAGAIYAIAKSLDDSGTYHTGGAAQYSAATGLRTSLGFRDNEEGLPSYNPNDNIDNQFGTGFGYVERGDQTISAVSGIAQALGTALDGVAVAFGETAGYAVATAFADDTSKDGAWGALRISKDGQELLNWENTRQSKWAPKEFGDGEGGYKEYLAAVAKDTRQVLLDMDLPSWADTMLESIGDAADMDQLSATLQQIGVIQTTFVQLGKTMEGFAGLTDKAFEALMKASGGIESLAANAGVYYENFYSAAEKTAVVKSGVSADLAAVGIDMPKTREEYRALVDAQLALGESGAAATAVLLEASGAFASFTPTIEQLVESVGISASQISTTIRDGLLGRISGEEVGASIGKMVTDGIYNAIAGSFADQITQIFMTGIVNPVIQAAITGSSISALVSQASIDAMVQQATAAMTALSTIFEDPEFLTAIAKINGAVGNLSVSPGGKSGLSGAESGYAAPAWEEAIDLDGLTDAVRGSWNDLISEIVNETKTAADELKKLTDFGKSSYQIDMEAIQSRAQDRTKEYWTPERKQAIYDVVNVKRQQQYQYDFSAGYYASMGPEWAAMAEWARNRADALGAEITTLLATIDSAPPEITALIAAEQELLRVRNTLKAADMTGDLQTEIDRLGMSDLERTLVGISDKADDYVKSLQDLGQATDANIGVVGEWEDAMRLDAIKKAWAGVTDSILGEIDRIRGNLSGDSGLAALQAEFAINTAAARAGDTEAGGTLARLSSDILRLSEGNAGSAFDWARMQAQMLASLQETARITSLIGGGMSPVSAASFAAPSQTYEISTPYMPPASQQGAGNAELIAEIRLLNRRLETLEANTQATALHTQKTSKALERAMPNGDAIATREMA